MSDDCVNCCVNCGGPLAWHAVAQRWTHADRGHLWCFPERSGYDQPSATPAASGAAPPGAVEYEEEP